MKNKEEHTFPFIERLLDGAKVEWKKLGEVCDFRNGFAFKSNFFKEKGLPIIRISNITGTSVDMSDVKYFDMQDYHKSGNPLDYSIEKGDVLIAMSGATTAKIGYYDKDEKAYQNQRVGKFVPQKNILNSRFLYHFLQTRTKYMYNLAGGGAQPNLSSNDIKEKILIPIPPLSVQERIVEILDKFITLEAELEAELDCRKRQYEYYRNQLLSFDMLNRGGKGLNSVSYLTLKDISINISSGGTPRSNIAAYYGGNIPWLRTQEVNFSEIWETELKITDEGMNSSSAKYIPANCIIVAMYGATVGRVAINKIPLTTNQACANIEINEKIASYRYVFHYLSSKYEYIKSLGAGSQTNINAGIVKKILIPIPPLSVQERIVSILDKFDTLTTSISEGLPKEIELRRKQYEYYRERLLSFKH